MKRTTTIASDMSELQDDMKQVTYWLEQAEGHMRDNDPSHSQICMRQAVNRAGLAMNAMSMTLLELERRNK